MKRNADRCLQVLLKADPSPSGQFIFLPGLLRTRAVTIITAATLCALFTPGVFAACGSSNERMIPKLQSGFAVPTPQQPAFRDEQSERSEGRKEPAMTGLWKTVFVSDGSVVNIGFNTWHSDGTEWALDGAFPPGQGNVCPGVWEKIGPRTYRTVHPAFNYDPSGTNVVSIFLEHLKVTISADGNCFHGTFTWDNYDFQGNLLPGSVAGTLTGTRIRVDRPFPFPVP